MKLALFRDKTGKVVLWQAPNPPLMAWAVLTLLGHFVPLLTRLGTLSLVIWAVLELWQGVNYFRRLLGLGVLLMIAAQWR